MMKNIRKIIEIDEELCDGCGQCVPDCAEGSLKIINGKAKLVADNLCDGLGACLGACPTGALKIIEREADEFDEEAVEAYLKEENNKDQDAPAKTISCECPSTQLQSFIPARKTNQKSSETATGNSLLSHWPVQIKLVPAHAPFLQKAALLIAADCTAVAARGFQEKYLTEKVVMMGCPKFDDVENYIQKFADIFKNCQLKSVTLLIMEVPCCSAMVGILQKAMERAKVTVPIHQITISTQGAEIGTQNW